MKKARMNLVFLPATAPGDDTYGAIPTRIFTNPDVSVRQVCYPSLVWYNDAVRREAIAQIRAWGIAPVVLVGFSKSGLGAWNIARVIPDLISATVIFDAPVAQKIPSWDLTAFYATDAEWQRDLPILTARDFQMAMPTTHQLVLISGTSFHGGMRTLLQALSQIGCKHVFLDRPDMKHHWNSGWIQEGLNELLAPGVSGDA